jgi:hypothetical protein
MALLHGSGTISATARSLLDIIFSGVAPTAQIPQPAQVGGPNDLACNFLSLQPDGGGANAMFVGGSSATTTSNYGVRLPAPAAGVPPAPYVLGAWSDKGPVKLSNVFIVGTAGETIHVLYDFW